MIAEALLKKQRGESQLPGRYLSQSFFASVCCRSDIIAAAVTTIRAFSKCSLYLAQGSSRSSLSSTRGNVHFSAKALQRRRHRLRSRCWTSPTRTWSQTSNTVCVALRDTAVAAMETKALSLCHSGEDALQGRCGNGGYVGAVRPLGGTTTTTPRPPSAPKSTHSKATISGHGWSPKLEFANIHAIYITIFTTASRPSCRINAYFVVLAFEESGRIRRFEVEVLLQQ